VQKRRGGAKQALIKRTAGAAIAEAKAHVAKRRRQLEREHENDLATAAVDFLGLKAADVSELKRVFRAMDARRRGYVRLREFFAHCRITRNPVFDAIFHFTDASFTGRVDFGTFLRTVCTFSMFGASDMVAWVYSVVAVNVMAACEKAESAYRKKSYKPGAQGWSLAKSEAVYWDGVVKWSGVAASEKTRGSMTTESFANLMYHLHVPAGGQVVAVKRAIERAGQMANEEGIVSPEDFRAIVREYPSVLAPLFLVQTEIRAAVLGEQWWGDRRQIFADARALLREQYEFSARIALQEREEGRRKKEEELAALLEEDAAEAAAAAAAAMGSGGGGGSVGGEGSLDSFGAGAGAAKAGVGAGLHARLAGAGAGAGARAGGYRRGSDSSFGDVDNMFDRLDTLPPDDDEEI